MILKMVLVLHRLLLVGTIMVAVAWGLTLLKEVRMKTDFDVCKTLVMQNFGVDQVI